MTRQKWIILAVGLAMIGVSAFVLNRLKTNQRLGQPGVRATPIAGSPRMDIYLPEHVLTYDSEVIPTDPGLLTGLPYDTSFVQRRYMSGGDRRNQLLLNIVLMGTDRSSIHKPQFCLKGMGWDIDDTESAEDTLRMTRPYPYDLPVMKLLTTRQVPVDGKFVTQRGVYVYWFVAENELTGNHFVRMRKITTHLLRTGELQRWAYVTCFAVCLPGEEKATYERIYRFLSASVPEFQLTAGPRLAAQNATQTASEKTPAPSEGLRN